AKTPNTDVPCLICTGAFDGTSPKTIGYPLPIATFTGRYLDSQATRDFQQSFRTARANTIMFAPERNRIYTLIGSALFAYNIDTFFTRLAAGETMISSLTGPIQRNIRYPLPAETFLRWDKYFYAENGSGWNCPLMDGQDRLFGFDWDDRGIVYLAYSAFGWGLVRDDGTSDGRQMTSLHQHFPEGDDLTPFRIMSVKTSAGHYYALVAAGGDATRTDVWDVTDPGNPVTQPRQQRAFQLFAKSKDGSRIAVIDGYDNLSIFSADALASGGPPMATFNAPSGKYQGIATDGINFYSSFAGKGLTFSVFSPAGSLYTEQRIGTPNIERLDGNVGPINITPVSLRYNSGFLAVSGLLDFGSWNTYLFQVVGSQVAYIDVNQYFAHYYYLSPQGYVHPSSAYINIFDSWVYKAGDRLYVLIAAKGLGDVYELQPTSQRRRVSHP
ncbi:MAG TPA: hypothetical protein VEZ11_18205, partial [Thermoanaerobaculia bacterium]|nr:hypothetical protein [Thermoanaerobaculia bacterium]